MTRIDELVTEIDIATETLKQEPKERFCMDCNHYRKLSLDCGRCDDSCSMFESVRIKRMNKINKIKLVIEMPEPDYLWIKKHVMTVNEQIIASGKLLDDVLNEIRAELIQSIQNGALKIESGNEELFRIIDKYRK